MASLKSSFPITIKEIYLDSFGHMNNATYLTLMEEARWDLITKRGYGIEKIKQTSLGPTIVEIKINFLREIKLHEEIIIETQMLSYEKKIGILLQKMLRNDEVCCTADFVIGLFDLKQRKLVLPTDDWLYAVGMKN